MNLGYCMMQASNQIKKTAVAKPKNVLKDSVVSEVRNVLCGMSSKKSGLGISK